MSATTMKAGDIIRLVMSRLPGLQELEAMTLYSSALRWLYAKHNWLFLLGNDVIVTEPAYTEGTLDVTHGDPTILGNGTGWDTAWQNRRIVIEGVATVFDVVIDDITTGRLQANGVDFPWPGESSSGGISYRIFRDVYALSSNFDWGREHFMWDTQQQKEMPIVDTTLMLREKAACPGMLGQPMAIARAPLQQSSSTVAPSAAIEFGPYAPDTVYSYDFWGFRKPAITTSDNDYPLWPESFQDLIPQRMQIEYSNNPRHRLVLSPDFLNEHRMLLWECEKRNAGGAEITRIRDRYRGGGSRNWPFRNVRVAPDPSGWPNV